MFVADVLDEQRRLIGPRPSDRWIKIGVGVLLIKHEIFQLL